MIIKNIAKLCKERKRICLYEEPRGGCQWIGDGYACYPLFGMPVIDEGTVFAVLDIPEDRRDSYIVTYEAWPEQLNASDDAEEKLLLQTDIGLVFKDKALMPARTSRGLLFYDPKYLNPLKDLDGFELYEREATGGGLYFAVKTGFLLRGIIMPKLPEPEKLADQMEALVRELRATINLREHAEAWEGEET